MINGKREPELWRDVFKCLTPETVKSICFSVRHTSRDQIAGAAVYKGAGHALSSASENGVTFPMTKARSVIRSFGTVVNRLVTMQPSSGFILMGRGLMSFPAQALLRNVQKARVDCPVDRCFSRDYEYRRLGTLSLLAGIDLQTGEAIPLVRETHNSKDYIDFLKILDEKYPKGDKIRLILDNLKVHTSDETRRYLATVPGRFEFVFTPKHGSWLNMVESFFSKMTKQMLRGIRVKSKAELEERIYRYFTEVNREPVVFHWKYNLDDVDVSETVIVDTLPLKKSS